MNPEPPKPNRKETRSRFPSALPFGPTAPVSSGPKATCTRMSEHSHRSTKKIRPREEKSRSWGSLPNSNEGSPRFYAAHVCRGVFLFPFDLFLIFSKHNLTSSPEAE